MVTKLSSDNILDERNFVDWCEICLKRCGRIVTHILGQAPSFYGKYFYTKKSYFAHVYVMSMFVSIIISQRWKKKWSIYAISTPRLNLSINGLDQGLRTPTEGINQRNLKMWANVADKVSGLQSMLQSYQKIWKWEWIFGRAVKAISSPGLGSPYNKPYVTK